jgi:hypothetical protein
MTSFELLIAGGGLTAARANKTRCHDDPVVAS